MDIIKRVIFETEDGIVYEMDTDKIINAELICLTALGSEAVLRMDIIVTDAMRRVINKQKELPDEVPIEGEIIE